MANLISAEPPDTIASKIIPVRKLLQDDTWRDPEAFRLRFLMPFRRHLNRAMPDMPIRIEVEGWEQDGLEPSIVLIARPRD